MPDFQYTAATSDGRATQGTIQGKSPEEVALTLHRRNLIPLRIALADSPGPARRRPRQALPGTSERSQGLGTSRLFGKPRTRDLILFAENLAVLLHAGIPLNRGLTILSDLTENRRFQHTIRKVTERIREGSPLWRALQAQQGVFPPVFVNMVRAGESGGVLAPVLERVATYLGGIQELKDYLFAAMIYPMVLAVMAMGSIAVMLVVVVPRFAQIFADMGVAMPLATRILLGLGDFLQQYWLVLVLFLIGAALLGRTLTRGPVWGLRWDALKLRLPMIGGMLRKIEIARFARTLGTLLGSGVSILAAMGIVKEVLQNRVLKASLEGVAEDLKQGRMLSTALDTRGVVPPLAVHLLSVGEETGNLESMLNKLAEIYDKDLRAAIKAFTALFEPLVILTMGLVIGMMVVSMLLAIFSINELAM